MSFELEQELKDKLLKIEGYEMLGDLDKRNLMINQAVTMASYLGISAGYRTVDADAPKPEWAGEVIAYISLPTGQVAYFTKRHDIEYDNHTREMKLERINDFLNGKHHQKEGMLDGEGQN